METNEPYPLEITKVINAFVDRIEQVLLESGTPRAERTSVCAEVESQIYTMIERRLEAGAELHLELVASIIESMDQPDSYAKSDSNATTVDPILVPESIPSSQPRASTSRPVEKQPFFASLRKKLSRPARTKPGLDWVAMAGLIASCAGALLAITGMVGRSEFFLVAGFFWVFAGVVASSVSFWRIRHSNGLLTGQRIASVGILMLPIVFSNAVLISILFATPIGLVIGAIMLVTALVYANYRLVLYALRWLDSYSAREASASNVNADDSLRQPESDAGQMPGAIASA